MKSGFTLIEVMLVLLIGSLLSTSLYMSFAVISKMVQHGNAQVRSDIGFGLISNQLEKDCMGAFLPIISAAAPEEAPATENESPAKKVAAPKATTTKLERAFYCTTGKAGNFGILTFVTNNPLQSYSPERMGSEKPRIARVAYRLVPEKDKPTFSLVRQESTELEYKAFESKNVRGYEIAQGIQSCKIELLYVPLEQNRAGVGGEKNKNGTTEAKKEPAPYIVVTEWDDSKKESEDKDKRPNLPQFIRFLITQVVGDGSPLELTVQAPIFAWETVIRRSDIEQIQQTQKREEQAKQADANKEAVGKEAQNPSSVRNANGRPALPAPLKPTVVR
jgi:prepilin-type N-terminal cleavage/methylation domain-containing protein